MLDLTSSVMTPLRTSLRRLCLGLTTSKNSVSCFLRNPETERGAAALCKEIRNLFQVTRRSLPPEHTNVVTRVSSVFQ